jgi:membrane protease YdiL (CAAX protease family)
MNDSKVKWVGIIVFVATAILLASLWAIHARDSGMLKDPQTAGIAASVAQLSVLVAAVFAMTIFSRTSFRQIGWRLGPFRAYATVFAIALLLIGLFSAVGLTSGWLRFAGTGSAKPTQVLVSFLILLVMSCLFSFSEEFGWRGFLLPQLLPLGVRRALLVSGGIWFLWEAPLVYFGLLDSTMIQVNFPLTIVCHLVQTCCVAIVLGYLRLRFGSVFLPTFAHGLLNALGGVSFMLLIQINPILGDLGGPSGTVLFVAIAAIIWRHIGSNQVSESGQLIG